jgi:hypothetical protein
MTPILFYPQTVEQANFLREFAEKQGVAEQRISQKIWEEFDDFLYGKKLEALRKKAKPISREQMMATFERKLKELA